MSEITTSVNWIAVTVGAIVAFALGWLWYSPKVFGTKWAEGTRITIDANSTPPASAMVTQAIATFLLAWVVGVTAVNEALLTMILITSSIVALIVSGGLFAGKSGYTMAIEAGYVVAMVVVMIIFQGIF